MWDDEDVQDKAVPTSIPSPRSPGRGREDGDLMEDGDVICWINPYYCHDAADAGDGDGDVSKLADVPAAKRKGVKRPQPKLDSQRLTSERGLPALRTLFENVRFKGRGHEVRLPHRRAVGSVPRHHSGVCLQAEDLQLLMQKMENWAHRLFPKLQFEEFVDKVERLGKKKEVQTCLKRIRLDMPLTHEDYTSQDGESPEP
ncbi:unnamed protein product, partial [Tetraodon nigroviridis]